MGLAQALCRRLASGKSAVSRGLGTHLLDVLIHLAKAVSWGEVPDVNLVVFGKAELPLALHPSKLKGHGIYLKLEVLSIVPMTAIALARPNAHSRPRSDDPAVVVFRRDANATSLAISNKNEMFARTHEGVLNESTTDEIVAFHVSTYEVARLHNKTLLSKYFPRGGTKLVVCRLLLCCQVHEE